MVRGATVRGAMVRVRGATVRATVRIPNPEPRSPRLKAMVGAVDKALEAHIVGISLTPEERSQVFGDFVPEDHDAEAQERWGATPAYAESQRRVAKYTKADWLRLKEEAAAITADLADTMRNGAPPGSVRAMDLAERHRQHLSRWFYDCNHEMHRGLGEMYVADPRFTSHFEAVAPGLAVYLRDAIVANADRRSGL